MSSERVIAACEPQGRLAHHRWGRGHRSYMRTPAGIGWTGVDWKLGVLCVGWMTWVIGKECRQVMKGYHRVIWRKGGCERRDQSVPGNGVLQACQRERRLLLACVVERIDTVDGTQRWIGPKRARIGPAE